MRKFAINIWICGVVALHPNVIKLGYLHASFTEFSTHYDIVNQRKGRCTTRALSLKVDKILKFHKRQSY